MNIFRTIASGKHAFREEFVSAFLAYLLSPKMDHGLGFTVLSRLLTHVAEKHQAAPLKDLSTQFKSRLWENIFDDEFSLPVVELEFAYPGGFIDIVIRIDNWFIMIENKIIQSSKKDNQIKEQYKGLHEVLRNREFGDNYRVLMIYLVPATQSPSGWSVSPSFSAEMDKVTLRGNDFKALVSWQPSTIEENDSISVISIIREILGDEASGMIAPISTEVRHALLSLVDFAMGEFQGFYYAKAASQKSGNPKCKVSEVFNMSGDYYIGVQYGRGGVVWKAWKNPDFLNSVVTLSEENRGWQYLPKEDFINLTKWCIDPENNSLEMLTWTNKPFGTQDLYRVAKFGKANMRIGIKGGVKALTDMSPEKIRARTEWQLSSEKKTSDWLTCVQFCSILEAKGISYE